MVEQLMSRTHRLRFAIAALAVATTLVGSGVASIARAAGDHALRGTVRAKAGKAMSGVTVSARAEGSNITVSVFTGPAGSYSFSDLPAGHYKVWAQAIGYTRAAREVDVGAARSQDFMLDILSDPEQKLRQLPADVLINGLPQTSPSDKAMVRMLRATCSDCHAPAYVLEQKFDLNGWTAVLNFMERFSIFGTYMGDRMTPEPDFVAHKAEMAAYLTRVRGPGASELQPVTPPRPTGEAARVVYREYTLPLDPDMALPADFTANDGSDWSEGAPSDLVPGFTAHDAAFDLDGNIWFVIASAPNHRGSFGRLDPKTGAIKLFHIEGHGGFDALTHGIVRDAAGNLWFGPSAGRGVLVKLDPKTEQTQTFTPPVPTGESTSLDVGPDGKIWMTARDGLVSFDPAQSAFAHFTIGLQNKKGTSRLSYGVAADRNGNGWWTLFPIDLVGKADAKTGKPLNISTFPDLPQQTLGIWRDSLGLRRMGADKTGQYVWIAASATPELARVDIDTYEVTMVDVPGGVQPYHVAVDRDHRVWFNSWMCDKIGRYDPNTKAWTFFDIPSRGSEIRHLSLLERDGKPPMVVAVEFRTRKILTMTLPEKAKGGTH
jgi:streptogramin lyase